MIVEAANPVRAVYDLPLEDVVGADSSAAEDKSRHLLHAAHQLKAPLAAIQAQSQLLLGGYCGPMPPRAVTAIEQIAARCETLSRTIKATLQLANLRSSVPNPPLPTIVDLAALIRSCLAELGPLAARRGIVFDTDLSPASVPCVGDHVMLMLDNIISNAVNYSHDGQPVAVSCRPKPDGGATVMVRDRGIGIPAAKLPYIFDDYFRTTEAAQHHKTSTGLGLAIVRQAALAGQIGVHVESAPAEGTVFTLDFPVTEGSVYGILTDSG